jgi:hypothetical protein
VVEGIVAVVVRVVEIEERRDVFVLVLVVAVDRDEVADDAPWTIR